MFSVISEFWNNITHAQAVLVAASVTFLGSVATPVALYFVGAAKLKSRTEEFKKDIEKAQKEIKTAKAEIENAQKDIGEARDASIMAMKVSSVSQADLDGKVENLEAAVEGLGRNVNTPGQEEMEQRKLQRNALQNQWTLVRDELLRRSQNPEIHGNRRNRYAGVTKNDNYRSLLDLMVADGHLGAHEQCFRDAQALWGT